MKQFIAAAALAFGAAGAAQACPTCTPTTPPNNGGNSVAIDVSANPTSASTAAANAGANSTANAAGGSVKTGDIGSTSGAAAAVKTGNIGSNSAATGGTLNVEKGAIQGGAGGQGGQGGAVVLGSGAIQGGDQKQTTSVGVDNKVGVDTKVTGTNTGINTSDNKSSAVTGPVNATTGSQNITFEGTKIPKPVVNSAFAPTIINGGGTNVASISTPDNPYASCFREKANQRTYSLALTAPFVSLAGGATPEKEDNADCIARIDQLQRTKRLAASGRAGQAAVIRADLAVDAPLAAAVAEGRTEIGTCPHADPVELQLTGVCPAKPQPAVTELVYVFVNAQGEKKEIKQSDLPACSKGQRRDPVTLECKNG